jgi:hypothetical protein
MAKNKLTHEQREALLEWLAADYDWRLIRDWFKENRWPAITKAAASYYRTTYAIDIERLRAERLDSALNRGLALKEERIARLAAHADELEKIKWVPADKNGRLWNEAAWRETLGEIAAEMGHRKQSVELSWQEEARRDGYDPDEIKAIVRRQFAEMVLQGRGRDIPGSSDGSGGTPAAGAGGDTSA